MREIDCGAFHFAVTRLEDAQHCSKPLKLRAATWLRLGESSGEQNRLGKEVLVLMASYRT